MLISVAMTFGIGLPCPIRWCQSMSHGWTKPWAVRLANLTEGITAIWFTIFIAGLVSGPTLTTTSRGRSIPHGIDGIATLADLWIALGRRDGVLGDER